MCYEGLWTFYKGLQKCLLLEIFIKSVTEGYECVTKVCESVTMFSIRNVNHNVTEALNVMNVLQKFMKVLQLFVRVFTVRNVYHHNVTEVMNVLQTWQRQLMEVFIDIS